VRFPLLLYLAGLSEAFPLAGAAAARRPVHGGRAWVLLWSALLLVHGVRNVWLSYIFSPAANATLLWALSCWQVSDLARLTMRLAIVPLLAVWAVLTLAFEDTSSFSRAADPLAYLVGLFAAAFTLIGRSRVSTSDLLRQDWFWVSAGLALYTGTFSMVGPLSALLVGSEPALMVKAYQFEAALSVVAFLAIARGVTCPAAA